MENIPEICEMALQTKATHAERQTSSAVRNRMWIRSIDNEIDNEKRLSVQIEMTSNVAAS